MTPEAAKADTAEPTMEEILASIRRIISEDGAKVEAAPPPTDAVLDLTEMMEADKPAPPPPPPVAPEVVMVEEKVAEVAPPPPPAPAAVAPPPPPAPVAEIPEAPVPAASDDRLISDIAARATAAAMSSLTHTHNGHGESLPMGNPGRTLESMVLELIRPVLKDWLDRNLPPLVERIVQKEIRKITRDLA